MQLEHVSGVRRDNVLLVTGSGPDTTGWFFVLDRDSRGAWVVEQLDEVASFGIAVHGGSLFRMLSSAVGNGSGAELLVYDETGVVAYRRIDGLVDPHGIVWTGKHFAVPSPPENGIALLDRFGTIAEWIRLPGTGDAWHVNGVAMRAGRLFASAFGRHKTERGWDTGNRAGEGLVFDVATGAPIVENLHCPHDPVFLDDAWVVCDSGSQRLLAMSERGRDVVREAKLGAWTRGFAVNGNELSVGLSGRRYAPDAFERAAVAVLDRRTWQMVERVELPCQEINTVASVPRILLGALRRGFRTNAMRTSIQDRYDVFRQVGNVHPVQPMTPMRALEPAEARIRFDALAPREVLAGERFLVEASIVNEGPRTLFTAMPFPVFVGYRWLLEADGAEVEALDERRHALPQPILPGATLRLTIPLVAPSAPGAYRLRMTLVQEWLRWFDADDAAMGVDFGLLVSRNRFTLAPPVPEDRKHQSETSYGTVARFA